MKKIEFFTESGSTLDRAIVNGINLAEIQKFLEDIDNESFEHVSLYYNERENCLSLEEETGVVFPQYGHFITKISESNFAKCFDFV